MRIEIDPVMIEELAKGPGGWEDVALEEKAEAVEQLAKRLVQVDSGHLKESIGGPNGPGGGHIKEGPTGRVAYVGSDVDYAIFQELDPGDVFPVTVEKYGGFPRVHHTGRAFLRPALQAVVR